MSRRDWSTVEAEGHRRPAWRSWPGVATLWHGKRLHSAFRATDVSAVTLSAGGELQVILRNGVECCFPGGESVNVEYFAGQMKAEAETAGYVAQAETHRLRCARAEAALVALVRRRDLGGDDGDLLSDLVTLIDEARDIVPPARGP
jgi:hypothetical protein